MGRFRVGEVGKPMHDLEPANVLYHERCSVKTAHSLNGIPYHPYSSQWNAKYERPELCQTTLATPKLAFARLFTWLAFPSTITKSKRGGSQKCAFNSTIPLLLAPLQSSCNLTLTLWILGMLFCGIWYRNSWEQFYTEIDTHTTKVYQKKIQSVKIVRTTVTTNYF